ncbi:hypothetical protein GALMADRAFT_278638, partial [Galerina marginata CBS 339.88]
MQRRTDPPSFTPPPDGATTDSLAHCCHPTAPPAGWTYDNYLARRCTLVRPCLRGLLRPCTPHGTHWGAALPASPYNEKEKKKKRRSEHYKYQDSPHDHLHHLSSMCCLSSNSHDPPVHRSSCSGQRHGGTPLAVHFLGGMPAAGAGLQRPPPTRRAICTTNTISRRGRGPG